MSIQYVAEIPMGIGEKRHITSKIKPSCEQDVPFTIRNARYELIDPGGELEDSGECKIDNDTHEIDALIQPKKVGTYKFKYIYEVADEIWVDCIKLKVS